MFGLRQPRHISTLPFASQGGRDRRPHGLNIKALFTRHPKLPIRLCSQNVRPICRGAHDPAHQLGLATPRRAKAGDGRVPFVLDVASRHPRITPSRPMPRLRNGSPRCGRRRRRWGFRGRRSKPRRAGWSPISRCPISPFRVARRRRSAGRPSSCRRPPTISRRPISRASRRKAPSCASSIARRSTASRSGSGCRARWCWRSGAGKPISAITSCRTARSGCWRPRPIRASARTCSARNSCWR